MRYHADARRRFWGDIFDTNGGDINVVQLNPGVVIAWHRHQRQDDRLFVLFGSALIQAVDEAGKRHKWALDASSATLITIPMRWWHGYSTLGGATILQFNGPGKWCDGPNQDEERLSLDEMPWTPIP